VAKKQTRLMYQLANPALTGLGVSGAKNQKLLAVDGIEVEAVPNIAEKM